MLYKATENHINNIGKCQKYFENDVGKTVKWYWGNVVKAIENHIRNIGKSHWEY